MPDLARLWLGEADESGTTTNVPHAASMVQINTNTDDMNRELYLSVSQRLFAAGSRDAWLTPIPLKKDGSRRSRSQRERRGLIADKKRNLRQSV